MNMSIQALLSTAIADIDDMSTLIMMSPVPSTSSAMCPSLPTSMTDLIAEHDRPYSDYGHLSMS